MNPKGLWLFNSEYFNGAVASWERFAQPDEEQFQAFLTRVSPTEGGDLFTATDDGAAHILITGALTKQPDFFFSLFERGGTVYGDIVRAIAAAEGDPAVDRIVLEIDSPGGEIAGLFEAAQAIAQATKPVVAEVTDMAASAAFALASQADSIIVNNPMARVGSVGIVTQRFIDDEVVTITSTDAPLKNPDASTPAGVAAIRSELDPIHAEFVQLIATGRNKSVNQVNTNFGRGKMLIASEALQAGMIDGIASENAEPPAEATTEENAMTIDELRAKHPDLCTTLRAEGISLEHDRVSAHVTMGAQSVAHGQLAASFILDGSDFTKQTVQASYMTAGQNATSIKAVQDDSDEIETTAGSPHDGGSAPDEAAANAATDAMFAEAKLDYGVVQ